MHDADEQQQQGKERDHPSSDKKHHRLGEIGRSLFQFGPREPQLLVDQIGYIAEEIAVAVDERTNPAKVGNQSAVPPSSDAELVSSSAATGAPDLDTEAASSTWSSAFFEI